MHSERTAGSSCKVELLKFYLKIRKHLFTLRVVKYLTRLPRGFRVSILWDSWNLTEHSSQQCVLTDPALSRGVGPEDLKRFLLAICDSVKQTNYDCLGCNLIKIIVVRDLVSLHAAVWFNFYIKIFRKLDCEIPHMLQIIRSITVFFHRNQCWQSWCATLSTAIEGWLKSSFWTGVLLLFLYKALTA